MKLVLGHDAHGRAQMIVRKAREKFPWKCSIARPNNPSSNSSF